ncbi:MAG: XisI protein [Chloroflexi bacterium]|nr:XisI protein [Chloroflexota bacterium]
MDRLSIAELVAVLRQEISRYAGVSDDSKAYLLRDDELKHYAVNAIMNEPGDDHAWVIVQAHIDGEHIIVDEDNVWDKNLWKALVAAGVPREQIVLAYQGEKVPTASEP